MTANETTIDKRQKLEEVNNSRASYLTNSHDYFFFYVFGKHNMQLDRDLVLLGMSFVFIFILYIFLKFLAIDNLI